MTDFCGIYRFLVFSLSIIKRGFAACFYQQLTKQKILAIKKHALPVDRLYSFSLCNRWGYRGRIVQSAGRIGQWMNKPRANKPGLMAKSASEQNGKGAKNPNWSHLILMLSYVFMSISWQGF